MFYISVPNPKISVYLTNLSIIELICSHCVKNVGIQSYSRPHFPAFGLNMERYKVSPRIQSEWGMCSLFRQCQFIQNFFNSMKFKLQLSKDERLQCPDKFLCRSIARIGHFLKCRFENLPICSCSYKTNTHRVSHS